MRLYAVPLNRRAEEKSEIEELPDGLLIRITGGQEKLVCTKEIKVRPINQKNGSRATVLHVLKGNFYMLNGVVHEYHTPGARIHHDPTHRLNLGRDGEYGIAFYP